MYTKILAQGAKFGSGATCLDNPAVQFVQYSLFPTHKPLEGIYVTWEQRDASKKFKIF